MARDESPLPGRSSLITSAPISARIIAQYGPAMCSVRSSTRTSWSGPRAFRSAMVSGASGDVARMAQHVGHRDLMEDEGERPDRAARRADRAGEERFVGGLDRADGGSPVRLELGEQLGHAEVCALGYLPVVVRVVAALHGAGRRRCLFGGGRSR